MRVKDNQPRLLESLAGWCAVQSPTDHLGTVDRHAHGREEHRRVEVFAAADCLDPDWRPFIACVVRVTRRTLCRASQIPLDAPACATSIRSHWGIEKQIFLLVNYCLFFSQAQEINIYTS